MQTLKLFLILLCISLTVACSSPEDRAARYLAKGQELFAAGDIVKAKIELQNALQIEPRNAEARLLSARISESEQDFRATIGHLIVAAESDPNNLDARVRLGTYYFLAKAEKEAADQLTAATELSPDDPDVKLLKARIHYMRGERQRALTAADAALTADPTNVDAIMFKASLMAQANDGDAALAVVNMGISEVDVDDSKPLRQFRIQLLRGLGRLDDVETELLSLTDDFPDEDAYPYALVQFYAQQDQIDKAEPLMREIADRDPSNSTNQLNLARFLSAQRGFEVAEEFLQSRIDSQPESTSLRMALGSLYETNQRRDDAMNVYRRVAEEAPTEDDGLRARNRIVALHLGANELDAARAGVASILVDAPNDVDALLYRAAFAYADQDYDSAIVDLRVALRNRESSQVGLLLLARSYVRDGNSVLAQDAYRQLLAINPNLPDARNELAGLMVRQGDTTTAEEMLRERLDVAPGDAGAAAGLIATLLEQENLEVAETEARKLVEITEGNALAQLQLGRVMRAKESPEEAIAAYTETLERNPQATAALSELTLVYLDNNRANEALVFLEQHRTENPDTFAEVRFLEGAAHSRLGAVDSARAAYRDVLKEDPLSTRSYLALAGLEAEGSNEQKNILEEGFKAVPSNLQLGALVASGYDQDGRWDDAITTYEKVLRANPGNPIALNNLAALLLDRRDDEASHDRAMQLAMQLRDNEQPVFLDTVGWAYYRQGDYPAAVEYLERAVEGAGELPVLRYHLGMAYLASDNPTAAKSELTRAIEESSGDDFVGIDEARAKLAELDAS